MTEGVGHRFTDPGLLRQALRHRSAGAPHNERMEFLGDALVNLIVRQLDIGGQLELGPGELLCGGQRRVYFLADALEAVVAAIHLDAGFEACRERVLPWFAPLIDELPIGKVEKDAKTRLQEWLQARQAARPDYFLIEAVGEEHARVFRVGCRIPDPPLEAEGQGSSLRSAEQAAAAGILDQLAPRKEAQA